MPTFSVCCDGFTKWVSFMFMGIDVSTTAAKALLLSEEGEVLDAASTALSISNPQPLWSEQSPHDWWAGVVSSIRQLLERHSAVDIRGIGLTGQMHGLTLLDAQGAVLRPALLWNDQRTGDECDEIRDRVGRSRLIELTGNDALTGFTAPKILWVRNHEPEVYARARHCLLPKDYIRYRLSGAFATDRAGAAGTGLLDLRTRDWSSEILEALEIEPSWLPLTCEGDAVNAEVSAEGAAETGLVAGTPIVAGAGDQAAQAIGVGATSRGICAITLGTSGVVFVSTDQPLIDGEARLHSFCHALPDQWHLMGVMLSAAGSMQWYRDTVAPDVAFSDLVSEAETVAPGCQGLRFLPYLTGERTPHPNPYARGGFIGLTLEHDRRHMTRAVLEGVAFGIRQCFDLMKASGVEAFEDVRISGGGSKSRLWCQILADVLQVPIWTLQETEGAALGAALLARRGIDRESSFCEPDRESHILPNSKFAATYQEALGEYSQLYPALEPWFNLRRQ